MSKLINSKLPCPNCPSSDAYHEYDDGHGYCFSCNYYKPPENTLNDFTYEFLPWRGVSKESFKHFGVLSKVSADGRPTSIGYPYPNGTTKIRKLDEKEFYWTGNKPEPGLFGLDKFAAGSHKSVVITEGELDACSMWQVLKIPVVSVQSASSAARDCAAARSWLAAFDRIYLAFDNDAPGREATAMVAKQFDYGRVYHVRFTNRKDANEYLQCGEENDLLNLFHNARLYVPDSITNTFSEFKKILSQPKKLGVPYPFPTLTQMTYGLRTGETVLLKAPEKVGKTALMHAFEHNILKRTNDNVAAIYLEEPRQRHLQSLAGIELQKPAHLPDCKVSDDEVYSALQKVVATDERLHIYNHFGVVDPEVLLDTFRFLVAGRGCRFVMFDHISMAVTGGAEVDERRKLEYLATRLEMMVKELDFALLMVSHVNDMGQTRGSHYLTKVADIVIDASRDTMALDDKERRTIKLSIPYNRYCSSTGPAGNIVFDPTTYTLTEEGPWQTSPSLVPAIEDISGPLRTKPKLG